MMTSDEISRAPFSSRLARSFSRIGSMYLDKTTVHLKTRWSVTSLIFVLYCVRVYFAQGFFVVTYGLGIYMLNLLIGFLTPQIDPETEAYVLPVRDSEEYRPFQRRLPEFKFWLSLTKALTVCLVMTMFRVFDLPVFWPILLIYFIFLFFLTIRRQLKHMIKHKYIPLSWGKQTYGDITRSPHNSQSQPHSQPVTQQVSVGGGGAGPPHHPHQQAEGYGYNAGGGVRGMTAPTRVHRM
eukprot:GHVN01047876.1.p1 GENE.GHVN01047876.1~~GHVN01047876.1.p1  ORF type:complete len:238 (+),score=41.88 GHVN01047876.1:332-1045(+)